MHIAVHWHQDATACCLCQLLMFEGGCSPLVRDSEGRTAASTAESSGQHPKTCELLMQQQDACHSVSGTSTESILRVINQKTDVSESSPSTEA